MDFEILKRVLAAFEARGVRYAIIDAVAMNLHGLTRSTEDLGIFVEPDAGNIDRLKRALTTPSTIPTSTTSRPRICSASIPLSSTFRPRRHFTSTS